MKGALGPRCHLLRDSGFLLTWLRGKCLARPIPNALVNRLPHPYTWGAPIIVPLFLPTLTAYRTDSAIARDDGERGLPFLQGRNENAHGAM